ncbi:MAG: hypothetical protein RL630_316 [Verrucomicrobiota bacterium]|jgi:beta-xylosidase
MTIDNPIVQGFYADPEIRFYNGTYHIYVTRSFTDYRLQQNLDAFTSRDLIHWQKHEDLIVREDFPWIEKAVWAPTVIEHGGRYFLIFASNDIQKLGEPGGLEIAVSDSPTGPFRGFLGRPLIHEFINGAQPIDAHLFKDCNQSVYLYWGGWDHCNVAKLNPNLDGFQRLPEGSLFREITPEGYREAPCMLESGGTYFFMWSSGNWANASYRVSYATAENPLGPFHQQGVILESSMIADGPGHHSCIPLEGSKDWLIAYHRRLIGASDPGARILCLDRMKIIDGKIQKITMTNSWIPHPETGDEAIPR